MSEFLGSRISLISKSDIRYVGVLHEINSDESTVSLENVRSFGTEGRKGRPEEEVGPSEQVYEYIVFRGSDVKDLRIEEHPGIKENKPSAMPDDPAIVGSARARPGPGPQGPQGPPQGPPGPNQNAPPPPGPGPYGQHPYPPNNFYGPPGAWGRGGPGPGPAPGPGFGNMPYPPPPGWFPPGQGFPPGPGGPAPWAGGPFPPGGPPPGAEAPPNQRAPQDPAQADNKNAPTNADQPQAATSSQAPPPTEPKSLAQPAHQPVEAPTPPVDSKPSTEEVKATAAVLASKEPSTAPEVVKAAPPAARTNRVNPVIPLSGSFVKPFQPPIAQEKASQATVQASVSATAAPGSVQDATSAARAAVAAAMAQLGNNAAPNPMDNLANKVNEMRVNATRGAPANRSRGRGGRPAGKVEVPDSDFDFAQSNAKFNKEDFLKETITGSPLNEAPNGHAPSAVESPVPASAENPAPYNKSRSFFDNISSEARERAENNGQRAGGREWRDEEQRRNMETFGQGSVDGGHRNFRGRGRGRGRGGRGRGVSRGGRGGQRPPYQTATADQ